MNPPDIPPAQVLEFGPFRLDLVGRVLLRDDRIVPLPPKVLDTLALLIGNRGRLVAKEELLRSIWPDTYVDQNSLMHNISVLRKVLGDGPDGKSYIETVPRRGYRFVAAVRTATSEPVQTSQTAARRKSRHLVAWVATLLVVAGAAGAAWVKPDALPAVKITPLTSYPGTEIFPTFSPDGKQVAFVWNGEKQDQFDIYVKTLAVEPPRRLTSDPESECHLQWSPDGVWIAYSLCGPTDANTPAGEVGLYVVPPTGGERRRVGYVFDGGNPEGRSFTWTADSKALISARAEGGTPDAGLFLLSFQGDFANRQLTRPEPGGWDTDPAVSPDGRRLSFVRCRAYGLSDIYIVGLNKELEPVGPPTRLTFENNFITNPLWTNDGSEILFLMGTGGAQGIWRVRARTGATPRQVPELSQPRLHLALSRQGRLVYSRQYWDFDIWRAQLDGNPSPTPTELIASTFTDAEPRYSPDGKSIAFMSNRSGFTEIWRSNADGTSPSQVTSLGGEAGSPAWSPDGTEIAFDCRLGDNVGIYVVRVTDGTVRRMTMDNGADVIPSWSRDGRWVYFACKRSGRLEVWKVAATGGDAVQVTKTGGFLAAESTDGKFLFYAKNAQFPTSLWRRTFATGQDERIIDSLGNWFYFAVFDDGVYFIPERRPTAKFDSFELKFYDFDTRSARTVVEVPKWPGVGFSVSPDRRSVVFAPSQSRGSDLMPIDNFR